MWHQRTRSHSRIRRKIDSLMKFYLNLILQVVHSQELSETELYIWVRSVYFPDRWLGLTSWPQDTSLNLLLTYHPSQCCRRRQHPWQGGGGKQPERSRAGRPPYILPQGMTNLGKGKESKVSKQELSSIGSYFTEFLGGSHEKISVKRLCRAL